MSSGIKILFLGEHESPNTISWVDGLEKLGCEVRIASVRSDGDDGVAYPIGSTSLPPRMRVLLGVSDVKRYIDDFKPDLMIAYRITSYGYLAASTGFHPLVLAAQNEQIVYLPFPSKIRLRLLKYFVRFAISKADMMHAWGNNIADGLMKYGANPSDILVMHRGIDLDTFSLSLGSRIFRTESPVFVSTRSLSSEYRIDHLIRAFNILLNDIPGASLNIIGTGPEFERLESFVEDMNLSDSISFFGRLAPSEVREQLLNSDIYISVIETEGVSSSLLEAFASGVFPLVTDMSASRGLIEHGVNGLLVCGESSPMELAEEMKRGVLDVEMRRASVEKNFNVISERFNRETNLREFMVMYRKLIDEPRRDR